MPSDSKKQIISFENCVKEIAALFSGTNTVAIDGRSASGKTTLAGAVRDITGCAVIHSDDFFIPKNERKDTVSSGVNLDVARFYEEVYIPLLNDAEEFEYRPFDCSAQTLKESITVKTKNGVIVEGAYSTCPDFGAAYDFTVFLTVSPGLQRERILARNGKEKAKDFFERWIPLEEEYFKKFEIENHCNFVYEITE